MASRKQPKNDDRSVVAAPVRYTSCPTLRQIRAAEQQAESGNLYGAAAICDWLLGDDRISGGLDARADALFGLVPAFEPSGDRRRSNRAVKALEAGEDWWAAYPESELRLFHKWALLLGAAPGRHYWLNSDDHGGRMLPMPEFWPASTLRFDFPKQTWFIRDSQSFEHQLVPGDGTWLLHSPFGKSRPWLYGFWRSLARWVRLKELGREDSGYLLDKATLLVGTTQEGSLKEERDELASDLVNSEADAVAILQSGYDLKRLDIGAGTGPLVKTLIDLADTAISIRIRGGNLSTNVEGGSKAAAQSQAKTNEEPKLRFDAESLSTTLHDQSLVWWAEFNFGDRKLAPYPVWPVEPEEDKQAKAETAKTMSEALTGFEKLGYEFDDKVLTEDYGLDFLKSRKTPEQRAKEAAAAAPPAAPAPGQDSDEGDDDAQDSAPPAKPKVSARMGDSVVVALASGAVPASSGFVEGQLWIDSLVETSTEHAKKALRATTDAILEELDAATDYDDLRTRLHKRYPELDPSQLSALMEKSMVLAELAGRAAVLQDL
jgi:hypothetical protein